jgi:carbonic anhydrase
MTTELKELLDSNRLWAKKMEARSPGFFTGLLSQQAPQYLWIGCADSRVPANELVDLAPGELFVHRNVANVGRALDLELPVGDPVRDRRAAGQAHLVVGHSELRRRARGAGDRRIGLADNWIRHVQDVRNRHQRVARQRRSAPARRRAVRAQRRRAGAQRVPEPPSCRTPGSAARRSSCTAGSTACTTACSKTCR